MRTDPKKRIDTNAAASPRAGLNPAFADLDVPNLNAENPPPRAADSPQRLWKMGRVILRKETAHRGGKTVIVIHDFATHLPSSVIDSIAKKLRSACGCGGTVKGRTIEMQGDQAAKIRAVLEAEGFEVAGVR
jgi:translation initiation factor 1